MEVSGLTLVDTTDTLVVYETALDPRLYVHPRHVHMDVLERSSTTTYCPYKGTASYWTAHVGDEVLDDVAWSYEDPLPESTPLGRLPQLRRFPRHPPARPASGGLIPEEGRTGYSIV